MTYKNLIILNNLLKEKKGKYIKNIYKIPNGVALEIDKNEFLVFSSNPKGLFILKKNEIPLLETLSLPLKGLKIVDSKLKKDDKVLAIKLSDSLKNKVLYVIFELTGRNSNFFILDKNRKVLYIFKPFQSKLRHIDVGKEYKFPPILFDISKEKDIPFDEEKEKFKNALKKQVLNTYIQKIKNLEKKLTKLNEEINKLSSLENPKEYLEKAELIKANLFKFNPNGYYEEIEVYDYKNNKKRKLKLNPTLTLKQNLNNIFKIYKKMKRKIENQNKIKKTLSLKASNLENYIYYLKTLLEENPFHPELLKILYGESSKKKKEEIDNILILKTKNGNLIFIGKNEKGNQKILKDIGNKTDIWFHVKNYPGSHVILKLNKPFENLEKNYESYKEDFIFAAKCAKIFSSLYKDIPLEEREKQLYEIIKKDEKKVDVDFTFLKNVRKIKGTLSKVTYKNQKTIIA